METVNIVGGGLAGTECALYLANCGIKVNLFDIKPDFTTPAHKSKNFAELVCSNSLKSKDVYGNACGLLKEEMLRLGSSVIKVAFECGVPAGNALAVDREKFSSTLTQMITSHKNIKVISAEVTDLLDGITVFATGPLTTDSLSKKISELVGEGLHFYDASAPIVTKESLDVDNYFVGDRYDKGDGDHINCPISKEEYTQLYNQLINAEKVVLKEFETTDVFEGCMPIEVMASRGFDTLRFGPLKPAGLTDPKTGRWPFACLQLRKENKEGSIYNLIGFQTNLKFGEQKRVFSIIPALKNAEFVRLGVMHRNTYINSPECLKSDFSLKQNPNVYFAGQITGVEGYVESTASGLMVAINIKRRLAGKKPIDFPNQTVLGSLCRHISTQTKDFQPMNANFGILPQTEYHIKDKAERKKYMAIRSLEKIDIIKREIDNDDV